MWRTAIRSAAQRGRGDLTVSKPTSPRLSLAPALYNDRAGPIAAAARRLVELRDNWLNPPDLARREQEVVAGFPDRFVSINEAAEKVLKKRTLTNLYNEHPAWLVNAHAQSDSAVAAAYGWPPEISEEEALARLFALNQQRTAAQAAALLPAKGP